jgi:hypothetical protein
MSKSQKKRRRQEGIIEHMAWTFAYNLRGQIVILNIMEIIL